MKTQVQLAFEFRCRKCREWTFVRAVQNKLIQHLDQFHQMYGENLAAIERGETDVIDTEFLTAPDYGVCGHCGELQSLEWKK